MPNDVKDSKPQVPASAGASGLWWIWLSIIAVVADQVTKIWALNSIDLGTHIEVLPIFTLTHVHNYGAAFSFLSDAGGWQRHFLTVLAIGISAMLLWWMRQTAKTNKILGMSYALILGGAIGNVIDRIAYGYVEDFIHFYYQSYSFPAFNIADSAITLGAMLLIYDAFTTPENNGKTQDSSLEKREVDND